MAQTSKRGLGKGFESLLPTDFDKKLLLNDDERIKKLPIKDIFPNEEQPRRYFDETELERLADSIRAHGILLPLIVIKQKGSKYMIVAGERRWRAASIAKLKTVPAVVRTMKRLDQLQVSLIENMQRVDLSPLEQAATLKSLHDQFSTPYETIAKQVGKASSTVTNIVRLLQLPKDAVDALNDQKITEGHARAILALRDDPQQQANLLEAILKYGWSVRQAERYVTSHKAGVRTPVEAQARVATETPQTRELAERLGTDVHLKRMANGGRLEIGFKTDEELEHIIARMQ
jgi:ParB family chromosome partitioning protein